MEGSIGFTARRSIQSRWTRRGRYQRLPATTPVAARGVRLGRRPVLLGSTARRLVSELGRIVGVHLKSMLPRSLRIACKLGGASPPKLRRAASKRGEIDYRYRRGVMLNFCVAEVLRRSSSEVRRSPLRPRKGASTRE